MQEIWRPRLWIKHFSTHFQRRKTTSCSVVPLINFLSLRGFTNFNFPNLLDHRYVCSNPKKLNKIALVVDASKRCLFCKWGLVRRWVVFFFLVLVSFGKESKRVLNKKQEQRFLLVLTWIFYLYFSTESSQGSWINCREFKVGTFFGNGRVGKHRENWSC